MSKPDLDIIHSPEAETFRRMVTKGFYDRSYLGLWMYEVIGREWDEMKAWAEGIKSEIHPQTCTWSIAIWEWVYGFENDETLSLEYRRQRILAKVLGTRPINPEVIRRGVEKITGCDVDIKDFAGPYRFSLTIHMPEDRDVFQYESVREYVRTVKPAHLAAFITWAFQVVIDNTQLEKFLFPQMRLHWYVPFWGCYVFDGTWNLDGSVKLCQQRRYDLRLGLKYYEGIFYELAAVYTKLFDGTWNLDGSVCLDAAYRSFCLKIYGKIESRGKTGSPLVRETLTFIIDFWRLIYFDGRWKLDGKACLDASRCRMEAAVKTHIVVNGNTEEIRDGLGEIRRNLWFLDGNVAMNGSRILNAMCRREVR